MNKFDPKRLPFADSYVAMRACMEEPQPFLTSLFPSIIVSNQVDLLAKTGITEYKRVDNHLWIVKVVFEKKTNGKEEQVECWFRAAPHNKEHSLDPSYLFTPLTEREVRFLLSKASQFTPQIETSS